MAGIFDTGIFDTGIFDTPALDATGSLAVTETGDDVFAGSGNVIVFGSLVTQEAGADVAAVGGRLIPATFVLGSITIRPALDARISLNRVA